MVADGDFFLVLHLIICYNKAVKKIDGIILDEEYDYDKKTIQRVM